MDGFVRVLEDGTEQVRITFKIPSRPKLSRALLSFYAGEIVLIQQEKSTVQLPSIATEGKLHAIAS